MFNWFKRLFGEGKIRVKFTTDEGRNGALIIDYIGDLETLNESVVFKKCRETLLVEYGLHLKSFKIIGITTS